MTRRALRFCIPAVFAAACACLVMTAPLPAVLGSGRGAVIVHDARGGILREPGGSDGLRAEWLALEDAPQALKDAIVAGEDHRLGHHPGVDPWAVLRALWLDARAGRAVSGASTLAMQLSRLVYNLPRTNLGKVEQASRGVFLQVRLGSRGVLEAYLNLAPFGRDLRGARAASRAYFGKPLQDLTVGESVALACLPRGPSLYDPLRHPARLKARRAHVLGLMRARGMIDAQASAAAMAEPLHLAHFERMFRAPHAASLALLEAQARSAALVSRVRTTLDPTLQTVAQAACRSAVQRLSHAAATDCAAVVMRASTAEVLALVGSPDFRSPNGGQVNAAVALRQPGSALKPFIYALAFEGGRSPSTLIDDSETRFVASFGEFAPRNYDERFHGVVTLREALANSYNIPALKLVSELGVGAVLARLRAVGLDTLSESAAHYGVGLGLGDGEVTLLALTTAYATLARGGQYRAPTLLSSAEAQGNVLKLSARATRRVFSPEVSYLVGHVLADKAARRAAFGRGGVLELPFDAAVKTGTSSDYRDNWTLGYAGDAVVGVWVGRHDGAPMHGVSGVAGAGPAFRRIMLAAVGRQAPRWPSPPAGVAWRAQGSLYDLALGAR